MIKVTWTENGVDYQLNEDGLRNDNGLSSMVIMCLFTDARAKESDVLPVDNDKRGWAGDSFSAFNWGSRFWLLAREKITVNTISRTQNYATEVLKPLVDFKLIKSTDITTERISRDSIELIIKVIKPDNTAENYQALLTWQAQQLETI